MSAIIASSAGRRDGPAERSDAPPSRAADGAVRSSGRPRDETQALSRINGWVPYVLVAIAATLTLVIILVSSRQLAVDRAQAMAGSMRDIENLARALEEQVAYTFMAADDLVWSIKQQVERRGLPSDLKQFVDERVLPGNPILIAHITDEQGTTRSHTIPNASINIGHVGHFKVNQVSDPGRLVIGEPALGRTTKKWSVHVSRRINKPDGGFAGIVSVAIDQAYFGRVYEEVKLGASGFIALIGSDGVVRAHHGPAATSFDEEAMARMLSGPGADRRTGTLVLPASGQRPEHMVAYRKLQQYPLAVLVGMQVEDALAQYLEYRADYISGVTIIVVLLWASFGLVGWVMVRQRRAAVELQEANARAESANHVKSEFLANMTHELRTPLNGIIGFADCLQEELDDESQRECARIIYSSGCTLLGMVNSVLDIAKIDAGRMELQMSRESVQLLVDEAIAIHAPTAEAKGLSLELDLAADLPEAFSCDRTKLIRVLSNLVHNAIKFTETGGIVVGSRMQGDALILSVNDTGCGIAPELHQAIFERFTQAEEAGVGVRGGTGLGLALARDLVRLMGGYMEVESRPGDGAEFRVVLPMRTV